LGGFGEAERPFAGADDPRPPRGMPSLVEYVSQAGASRAGGFKDQFLAYDSRSALPRLPQDTNARGLRRGKVVLGSVPPHGAKIVRVRYGGEGARRRRPLPGRLLPAAGVRRGPSAFSRRLDSGLLACAVLAAHSYGP